MPIRGLSFVGRLNGSSLLVHFARLLLFGHVWMAVRLVLSTLDHFAAQLAS